MDYIYTKEKIIYHKNIINILLYLFYKLDILLYFFEIYRLLLKEKVFYC